MLLSNTKLIQELQQHTPFLLMADFHLHPFTLGGEGDGAVTELKSTE